MQLDVASTFQTDMKNDEITDGQSVVDFDSQAPRESALAYKYFELYRDAGQQRSLRSLCEHTVEGKKRSLSQIGRWSRKFLGRNALKPLTPRTPNWRSKGSPLSGKKK